MISLIVFCTVIFTLFACAKATTQQDLLDIVILNGQVVDGTGNPWYLADVGIKDGRIVKVGTISVEEGLKTIDAKGLIVAPGFIDIHNHSDIDLTIDPRAESMVRQGVATIVIGNCGEGAAPSEQWPSFGDYLARLEETGVGCNVAALVPHGQVRTMVIWVKKGGWPLLMSWSG